MSAIGLALALDVNSSPQQEWEGYSHFGGTGYATYNEFHVGVGYENGRNKLMGQTLGKFEAITIGAGYTFKFGKHFTITPEVGYWEPWHTVVDPQIQDEVAFSYLVTTHHLEGLKPIPLQQITLPDGTTDYGACSDWGGVYYPDQCYSSEFTVGGNWYAQLGVGFEIDGLNISVNYRHLKPYSELKVFDPERYANKEGWWEETGLLQFSTIGIEVRYDF